MNHNEVKVISVTGRYVVYDQIRKVLNDLAGDSMVEIMGSSVQGRDIPCVTLGSGSVKILMWSQMHGNESTTTKAVMDLIRTLHQKSREAAEILHGTTIRIIPMLNPDGAEVYTRENAAGVDLNRDAQDLSQPESRLLRELYDRFNPDYCFNLHDQRSIFSAGNEALPATISFLAPAADQDRSLTSSRKESMRLIAAMAAKLKPLLGRGIGRYDDAYNPDCVGDTFQSLGIPTVLFEAGHYPGDYQREETRKYIWHAMMSGLLTITRGRLGDFTVEQYLEIPNNEKRFFDILIRNAYKLGRSFDKKGDIGILYKEELEKGRIHFKPNIETIDLLDDHYGHEEFDCEDSEAVKKLKSRPDLKAILF